MLGIIYSGFAMLASYRIIRIEDDPTPLAAGTHSTGIYSRAVQEGYYGDTLAAMLLIGLILMATAYILLCIRYRKRIRELQPGGTSGMELVEAQKADHGAGISESRRNCRRHP